MRSSLAILVLLIPFAVATASIAVLTHDPGSLDCVTGETAQNPTQTSPDGNEFTLPTDTQFETVAEGERWICLDVQQAELLPGWQVLGVVAQRSHSLDMFSDGRGFRALEIWYDNADLDTRVRLFVPGDATISAGASEEIDIQGTTATLWLHGNDPYFTLQWGEGASAVIARGTLPPGVELERDILPLLETVK